MIAKFRTVEYDPEKNHLIILDQTRLPVRESYIRLKTVNDVINSIRQLKVRGAPLIGVAAAYGVVIASRNDSMKKVNSAIRSIAKARPTAVNLSWALHRMQERAQVSDELYPALLHEALLIEKEDKDSCLTIGRIGVRLIPSAANIMVYCNAGALATTGIGTALGIIYTAKQHKKKIEVFACETRPLLQGSRLTSWELTKNQIKTHIICDNMAAHFMPKMSMIFIGADRIASNGDTANKIGSKGLAIIANAHGVPFYVAAPRSSFDLKIKNGSSIPIEQRGHNEITFFNKKCIVASQAMISNPAFDVTPNHLISAFITERGIIKPPFKRNIARLLSRTNGPDRR
ncbi:S-methyl-5-thioribose-1-phosphate isomerase [candidate division WOR-3 bacterium RBG_13_43_14]|uniref:Methylthioribose-1-phosphate isomerase n=1 Tax=candidate division WOR-3 bacterium RBG_13_43_14 TaxID=1802590 RepID=A0A1F4U930_UNCW3|nr:MAG: S-methyl-5-thioribose-1-phosphate isomerase [candidate division WOR-3 bacterium RBG_13_43_14]